MVSSKTRVLLYSPPFFDSPFRHDVIDGENIELLATLLAHGCDATLLDCYHKNDLNPSLPEYLASIAESPEALIVHLWKSDAYGRPLERVASTLADVRRQFGLKILAYGYLAYAARDDLLANQAVDSIVSADATFPRDSRLDIVETVLVDKIQSFLKQSRGMGECPSQLLPRTRDSIFSLTSSRGCRARCSFCGYNADLSKGWSGRSMYDVARDLERLVDVGFSRFAFSDNDFAGDADTVHRRANDFLCALESRHLLGKVTFTLNARSDTLNAETVALLAQCGVNVLLLGVESFNAETLRIFRKKVEFSNLRNVLRACDENEIVALTSYIMWHPWQTLDSVRRELSLLNEIGVHRVPQFLYESRLRVTPYTSIEGVIESEGLLIKAPFRRNFIFRSASVAYLYQSLKEWHTSAMRMLSGVDHAGVNLKIASIKKEEVEWLESGLRGQFIQK